MKTLNIERCFTKSGDLEDVFNAVAWNRRDVVIATEDKTNVFVQKDVEAPVTWSDTAVTIVASKYFRGHLDTASRETSVAEVIRRVVRSIAQYGQKAGYFNAQGAKVFRAELGYMLVHQMMAFNSPVWFNVGATEHPQCSACFIQGVEDDMASIMQLAQNEVMLFKGGSGTGSNLSKIRSAQEPISGAGLASGPVSFMRGFDAFAGVIKSGGRCLVGRQRVYTENGPVRVDELLDRPFLVLSYDPPASRFKVKRASAWASGVKKVVRVTTDKGVFEVSHDHPFRLSSHETVRAENLTAGLSLLACSIDAHEGYARVHLRDGRKGKDKLHRMVLSDVYNVDLDNKVVHHIDRNKMNNARDNLEVLSQAEHAGKHGAEEAANGTHVFQATAYRHEGASNGMHHTSAFWQDPKATAYRALQGRVLEASGRAPAMQKEAARQKMLNSAFKVLNAGRSIDTFEDYVVGRKEVIGRIPSISQLEQKIVAHFGSYESFKSEVSANNHRVVAVEVLGEEPVFSVEVECPTEDDKTAASGHNFVIWPDGSPVGSGVVVLNTRRAAKMVILNVDHPDILEFIGCKAKEEKKAQALLAAGFSGGIDGEAYGTIAFQNANHSVRVTDEFMEAAVTGRPWHLTARRTGATLKTVNARDLLMKIAEAAHACGDPGLQYDGELQRWHTARASGTRIEGSNPCQPGFASVLTEDGIRTFDDVQVGTRVWTSQGFSPVVRKVATGMKNVYRYETTIGDFVGTEDHRVFEQGDRVRVADAVTIDALIGPEVQTTHWIAKHVLQGLMIGDGSCISANDGANQYQVLYVGEDDTDYFEDPFIAPMINNKFDVQSWRVEHCLDNDAFKPLWERTVPADILRGSVAVRTSFLRGLYSANGSVVADRVTLKTTSKALRRDVQMMLSSLGIRSYFTTNPAKEVTHKNGVYTSKESYDINITTGRDLFADKIGFIQKYKNVKLSTSLGRNAPPKKTSFEVRSVEDLGLMPVYDIEVEASTHDYWTSGLRVSNCSEYVYIDDTACNLASLNLVKFQRSDGSFDEAMFAAGVSLTIIAQDILVGLSSYPTAKIHENSHEHRTLGIGYANLGALLMRTGLPYDSEVGRSVAAEITSLMTAVAYKTSAQIAAARGPCEAWTANKDSVLEVMNMHAEKSRRLVGLDYLAWTWNDTVARVKKHGVRNMQVSLLAPTGTIAFMMDCDTTGIEPDIALVKYKRLVGGGTIKIVNQSVPQALRFLSYDARKIEHIVKYIEQNDTIEGAPDLDPAHLPVFDCAFRAAKGTRSIAPIGHVLMMAAVQPFLSGAISKTVNLPESATVQNIYDLYMKAWGLGIKCLAVYRDGCKKVQPLSTSKTEKQDQSEASDASRLLRRKLPLERAAVTRKFTVSGHEGYITVGMFEDGTPGELFITMSKEGSTISGLMDTIATQTSIALQYGVPLHVLVDKFSHMRFEPSGYTGDKDIPIAKSIVDYIFRWLGQKFLRAEHESTPAEPAMASVPSLTPPALDQSDAPLCVNCGSITVRSGTCYACPTCGTTSGCS